MSIANAIQRHVFGLKGDVASNVVYVDEQTILYPAGGNIVLFNTDAKSQRFVPTTPGALGVTCLAVSPNRRYLAVAEKGQKGTASIYDLHSLRKRKVLSHADCQSQEFVSLAFSPDSKYLVAQSGRPDWMLVYWTWEKSKVNAVTKSTNAQNSPVFQVTFNPQDNTQLCVVGSGIFKLYRYSEGNLKQFAVQRNETNNYLCQTWVSEDRVVAGTDQGKVVLFEAGEMKAEIAVTSHTARSGMTSAAERSSMVSGTAAESSTVPSVRAILSHSKGFFCCCGNGLVHGYERSDEKEREYYKKVKEIEVPTAMSDVQGSQIFVDVGREVTAIALSPSEDSLVCSTQGQQLYTLMLSSAEISKQGERPEFDLLSHPFHSGPITGMGVCARKPLVATCSMDKTVRIWNYETHVLELQKDFPEEAYSVALHPSGLFLLAGFSDKLRLMNLLIDDIRPFKEFTLRGCRECAFSHGGHLFAAVHGNVIQIYSTYSFENIGNLKGHNGKIRGLVWSHDDGKIISCGQEGAVYEWSVKTCKREGETVLKSCSYTGVTLSPDAKTTYAVGSDRTLKEMILTESQVVRDVGSDDVVLTQIVLSRSGRMMFTGTSSGSVRSIKFPLTVPGEWTEHQAHAGSVTKMRLSWDDQYLFTGGEDGSLCLFRVQDKEGRGLKRDREIQYAEEILITKSDLEEKNQVMTELKTRVEELKMENEYQLRLKDMNYNEKIKELTEKFMQEMETLKTRHQVLKTEKDKDEVRHTEYLSEISARHQREQQELESLNNQKLMAEYEKYQELQAKAQKMQEDYERQLTFSEEAKEQAVSETTEYYEGQKAELEARLKQIEEEKEYLQREHKETQRQIEEDADQEILDVKNKYERRLRDEVEANMRLKGETGIMKKKFATLEKERKEQKEEIQRLHGEENKLRSVIRSLEKDIVGLKKEIQERDETIQDKEKRIYDLKKKNQELEKFKFVLDYKIKELKKQIEPRETEIKAKEDQINEMEQELDQFHKKNQSLELRITELNQKLKASDKELRRERQRVHDTEAVCKRFQTDLHHTVGLIQEPKQLKESVEQLYRKHVGDDKPELVRVDQDIQQEYGRQREHLERSVASLRKKLAKDSEIHRADNVRIMQENVTLIREINDLRKELKIARGQVHDFEVALTVAKKQGMGVSAAFPDRFGKSTSSLESADAAENVRIIDMQRNEIRKQRQRIEELENSALRPSSTGKLPALTAH